jgi:hypothetical protein
LALFICLEIAMPYMVVKRENKYLVYKKDTQGQPEGDSLGEHDTPEDANKQIAAIHANEGIKAEESMKIRTGYFSEMASLQEAEFDAENKKVRVTLIRPGWSLNERYYASDVLKKAAGLFEGAKAYFDHPSKSELKERPERSIRDLAGWYEDVHPETDGRLTGTLHLISDTALPIIEAAVKRNPSLAGLSINALGNTRMGEIDGRKGVIVEAIVKANSTDIVTTPGAGGKFEMLMMSADEYTRDLLKAMPIEELQSELREVRPDLVIAWQKEWKTARDTNAVKTARDEKQKLEEAVKNLEEQCRTSQQQLEEAHKQVATLKHVAEVDRVLSNSQLPRAWRDQVREQLVKVRPEEMQSIVEAEIKKAQAVKPAVQVSGVGATSGKPTMVLPVNPVAESLGINSQLTHAKDYREYVLLKQQQRNMKNG